MIICENCGIEKDNAFVSGGKHFCGEDCAKTFFAARNVSPVGTDMLTAEEVRHVEQSQNELINNIEQRNTVMEMTRDALFQHLTMIKRQMQELRARERITHARINKLVALGENAKNEGYRKLGVNSDLEAKKKVHSVLQKSIQSYRKMGMDDLKIRKMMVEQLEFEAEKVDIAFKELMA